MPCCPDACDGVGFDCRFSLALALGVGQSRRSSVRFPPLDRVPEQARGVGQVIPLADGKNEEPSQQKEDGAPLPLSETLAEADCLIGPAFRPADEGFGLVQDVRRLRRTLTPACRDMADVLIEMTPTEVAATLGIHRSTVYARLASMRSAAVARGLEVYLGATPTVPAPGR